MYNSHTQLALAASRQADLLREAEAARMATIARQGSRGRSGRLPELSLAARLRQQVSSAAASIVLILG